MRIIKVKANFKGADGSCGYKRNNDYVLIIRHKMESFIQIEDIDGGGWCEYGSVVSFLENWDNISRIMNHLKP